MYHHAFLIVAAVLFLLAGCGVNTGRANLTALGLLFWVLAVLFGGR